MENKFTLNEAFDVLYEEFLNEQLQEDITSLSEDLEENQNQFMDSLDILSEALLLEVKDLKSGEEGGEEGGKGKGKKDDDEDDVKGDKYENVYKHAMDMYDQMSARAEKKFAGNISRADEEKGLGSYKPTAQFVQVEKIGDMKFPQNVIFFITQLIKWIKNNILNFIDKFSNIVRSLLGLRAGESRFSEKDLKLNLAKTKEIETKYYVDGTEAYETKRSFSDFLNGTRGQQVSAVKPVSMFDVDYKDVKLFEGINIFTDGGVLNEAGDINYDEDNKSRSVKVIRLDTSRDLFALKQSLEHFFELFDNAFGSNDEKLFSVEDLELMLQIFKNTLAAITNSTEATKAIEIRGQLSFSGDAINATKLKDNLLRTKINTDNLKQAYVVTNKQINALAQIIMNKNLIGATQMGVQYAFLSASTYEIMIELIGIIDTRLKEAKAMEGKLQKMKKSYENLVSVLDKRRAQLNAISGMTYTTILQRRVNELYDGARYMTQTIQLRLNTLALYISELNDTRAILKNLNAIPESAMKQNRSLFDKFKALFKK